MARVTSLLLFLLVVSTMDFQRTAATETADEDQSPKEGEIKNITDAPEDLIANMEIQKGLDLIKNELTKEAKSEDDKQSGEAKSEDDKQSGEAKSEDDKKSGEAKSEEGEPSKEAKSEEGEPSKEAKSEDESSNEAKSEEDVNKENSLNKAEIETSFEDALADISTEDLVNSAEENISPSVPAAPNAGGVLRAENEAFFDAAEVFADMHPLRDSGTSGATAAAAAAAGTGNLWPWNRAMNAIRNTQAYACVSDPVRLLRTFFPSLDEEALRNVGKFFSLFSIRSLFTKKVLNVLQSAVRGDFRPFIQGISNTLFAFNMKRINAEGGYIGHKLTIKTPVKDVFIKYFINPSSIKLGVTMTGLPPQVIDLKRLIGSSMNYVCTPIPGIIGAFGCLRIEMEHPLHGIGNQVCMSGFMRYVFGDGPSMYFGCLKMNIPSLEGAASSLISSSNKNGTLIVEEITHDDEQIQGLDLDDKEEDEMLAAKGAGQEAEQQKSMFEGATDYLVHGLSDILDRLELSDGDKDTLSRTKQALENMVAFKDTNGRLSVTTNFVSSLFLPAPAKPVEEIKEVQNEGHSGSEEENGEKGGDKSGTL